MALDLSAKRYGSKPLPKGAEATGEQIMANANAKKLVQNARAINRRNDFIKDLDDFFYSVDNDTKQENIFNAAKYFEERQKQAENLKQRAAALSLYTQDYEDIYTPESNEAFQNILATFDTQVDEVITNLDSYFNQWGSYDAYDDYQAKRNLDLDIARQEIADLQAARDDYEWNHEIDWTKAHERKAFDLYLKDLDKQISDKRQFMNRAKRLQEYLDLSSVTGNDDFSANSGYVRTEENTPINRLANMLGLDTNRDITYEYINNRGLQDQLRLNHSHPELTAKNYDMMTDKEVGVYNYYYATEGAEKAQQYLDNIQEDLNYRKANKWAQDMAGNTAQEYVFGAAAGLNQFGEGVKSFVNTVDDYLNYSAYQIASPQVREDLADDGFKLPEFMGGASVGQIGYDVINTTANMAPSILASTAIGFLNPAAGKIVGTALMGASASGNAYQEALNNGYSKQQARTYSALVGGSEAGLEYLLGGISALGGTGETISKVVSGVDNAFARFALNLGGSMASEGFEEGLQEVLTPWFKNLTLMANEDVDWNEVAYSTLLGALSAGVMEAPGSVSNSIRRNAPTTADPSSYEQPEVSEPITAPRTKVSEDGMARQITTNQPIDVLDFASIKNGKATIQLKDGGTVDYADVSFPTEADGNRFYAVTSLPGIETEAANDLLHTIEEANAGGDIDSVTGIREAYGMGYYGMQESDLAKGTDSSRLAPDLRKAVFDIGRQQRNADALAKPTATAVTAKPAEGYKKVVFEGNVNRTIKKNAAEIRFVDYIAENFSGNTVHIYESFRGRDGKYYYRDSNGKLNRAPNGRYVNGEIWLDTRAGDNGEGLMLNTFSHEMYHHIEKYNKAKAQELAEFVSKELGFESVEKSVAEQIKKARKAGLGESYFVSKGMSEEQARNEVYNRAMSDFVADSLETMFTRGDPAKAIANLKQENRTLFDEIKAFIDKWVSKLKKYYSDKTISKEGEIVAQLENFEKLQQLFMEAMQGAGENYNNALGNITPGEAGILVNENGDPVAMSTDDGSVMLSIRTYEEDGRKAFRNYLNKCVTSERLTEAEAKEMREGIEEIYQICKDFKDQFAPFSKWSDAEVIRDTHGRPVFSVVTPNGDYKMNLDFSLVCKKRRTLDAVFNEMSRRGIIDDFELGQKSVVKINEIIRKYGLETACALCFVDAKRFRQASMADSFTRLYNELVESLVPENQKKSIGYFNFSGYETIKNPDNAIDTWENSRLDFSHLDKVMKEYGKGTVEHKAARYIKSRPEGRKLLLRGDFMSSQGFDAVKIQNKDILKLYNSKKGTGGPKAAFGDVQYLNEIIKKERTWTPAKAYEVGGVRIQSFSDYVPRMVFDYVQMIYDLSVRKLPAHAYTKESVFVKQFGLTGVKINMSLIPAIAEGGIAPGLDADGNYVWAGESFDYDTAEDIQNAEGYTENCGTICVGVSKQHIEKLLRDPNIRMVIPYHKSGLNPIVAHMNKIAEFTDYTSLATNPGGCQNTVDKDGKRVAKDFNFNEAVKRTGDPKAAANEYLKWCMSNGYIAKFAEFATEKNYYKLLADFTLYDKNGKYVPQREVRAVFPKKTDAFGSMRDLIEAGLKEDAIVEGKRDKNLSSIVDEIQRTLPKTEAEIREDQVSQADRDLEAEAQYSIRDTDTDQFKKWFGKSKVTNEDGSPKVMYHGTSNSGFSIFDTYFSRFGLFGRGFYFTDSEEIAESYTQKGKGKNPGVYDVYLSIQNPIDMDAKANINAWKQAFDQMDLDVSYLYDVNTNEDAFRALKSVLQDEGYVKWEAEDIVSSILESMGHDGVTHIGGGRYGTKDGPIHRVYIAFNSEQIKSASKNNGNFDPDHPNIYYSLRNEENSPRTILSRIDPNSRKLKSEQQHLGFYQERLKQLGVAEKRLNEVNAKIRSLPENSKREIQKLQIEARNYQHNIDILNREIRRAEMSEMFKRIVAEERKKVSDTALRDYKKEQRENIRSMQAENRAIREELTGTQSVMSIMEDEFVRLAKDLEAKKIDLNTMQEMFLNQSKQYDKDTQKWLREYRNLMSQYRKLDARNDRNLSKIEQLEEIIQRQRQTAKAKVTSRRNTEMRHKIQRKANELNQLLIHGTKHRNVPEYLQPVVADILNAINMEVRDGDQRRASYEATLARYDQRIAMTTNPAEVSRLIEKRNEYAAKGDQFANKMAELKEAYQKIQDDKIPNMEIDEGLSARLMELFVIVGDTPLGQMTSEQLDAVNDVLNITKATITNANKLFQEGQRKGIEEISKSTMREVRSVGGGARKTTDAMDSISKFGWNNLKPVYAFEEIGSNTLTGLFNNLRKGEDTLAVDLSEAKTFFQTQWQKHHGKDWDMEKKWKFTSTAGKSFELDLNQIMSLYALSKRDQARDHLRVGGFSFDSQYKRRDEIKVGPFRLKADVKTTDASAYNLTDEALGEIIGKLTDDQRKFVDAMQAYLSDTMAAKGNEVSLQKYGIRLFKEQNYFPLRVADQYMAKVREQQTGDRKLKNSGFTKSVIPHAKNPVVLSSFTDVWAEHVDEMSLYHSFVLPLDDMSRVLNYHDMFTEETAAGSVVEAIRNAYGEGATQYIDQLIRDVNGGARTDSVANTINKWMGKAKKAQTMASLSVAIQQPSAILRACSMIDGKYFVGPKVTEKSHDSTWSEIKKWAPVAIIKEMGGFDVNVGKSTVDYLTDTADYNTFGEKFKALFTDEQFRDDVFGKLPALMDEMAWGAIWNAVKREQAELHPSVKGDAFMKLVSDRFTDVIVHTQVYDSVFSRSGMMRSKDTGAKMMTSFMAEPTTTINMLQNAVMQTKRGKITKAQAAKTVGAIVASMALNSALVSVVYAVRDDDEDKRYDEKWIESFYENFFNSLNPMGYIPFLRDIQNAFRGYDTERADVTLFGDLMNAIDGLGNEDLSAWAKVEAILGSVGNIFGVPVKNILRDGRGIAKTISIALDKESRDPATKTGRQMARMSGLQSAAKGINPFVNVDTYNNGEEMLLAIQKGDEDHIQRVFGRFENQQKAESALQSAIREKYVAGDLTEDEVNELLTNYFDREDDNEVYWIMDQWDYAKENGSADGYTKYGNLYQTIDSGDYEAEINRLLEHGADASTIRSQISKKYRKEYLADETVREEIRETLLPVYEATGMDGADIMDKFHDWDFEAEYGMTYSEFKSEYKAGNATEAEMRQAMKFNGMLNYEIEEDIRSLNKEKKFETKYGMSISEMRNAYDNGDISKNQLIEALVFNGATKTEAQDEVGQRDVTNKYGIDYMKLDDAYKYGDISRQTFYNSLLENGATKQEADEAILGYDWLKKNVKSHPELQISDARRFVLKVSDKMEERTLTDYGVSVDSYLEYKEKAKDCKGVDSDGDGYADPYTKAKQLFAMIDELPISDEAKDGLALVSNAKSTIKKYAPWH